MRKEDYYLIKLEETEYLMKYMWRTGYSENTIKSYTNYFNRYMHESNKEFTIEAINNYMYTLMYTKECSHTFCNQVINALKLYAKITNHPDYNRFKYYPRPRGEKSFLK
jgi:site-specific recombinase XerD